MNDSIGKEASHTADRWSWMAGTYWYVPTETLPAVLMLDIRTPRTSLVDDQTLWFIERFESGYLIGQAAISINGGDFTYMTLVGSVTPEGDVSLSFAPVDAASGSQDSGTVPPTTGRGRMVRRDGQWAFLMQMTGGSTSTSLTHWSYMQQSTPDDESWNDIPGVPGTSVAAVFAD